MNQFGTTLRTRRSFLKTGGILLSVPFLESFASAEDLKAADPKRLVFLGGGYGFTEETFYPKKAGKFSDIGLTEGLKPLKKHAKDILMVANLFNPKVNDPHAGSSGYLSGTLGKVSCDQIAAAKFGDFSRYPSLVLTSKGDKSGHGRSGLSLSTAHNGKPIAGIKRPIDLYFQLFGNGQVSPKKLEQMLARKKSILDIVSENGISMKGRIAAHDKERIEEYFESVRDIELRLKRQAEWADVPKPKADFKTPDQGLSGEEEIRLTLDMIIIALQTDSTRVASYRFPIESLLKSLEVGISSHALSHYKFSKSKREDSQKRDHKLMELFAYFIDKLKTTNDRNGLKLYDTTIASYGSNLRTGHTLNNCPALLTGGAAKNFKLGEHIMLPELTPMSSYWLTVLQQAGIDIAQFNDSRGELSNILV